MVDLIIIGNTAKDRNTFTRINGNIDIVENNGGACFYAASGASRYCNVGVVSKVGNDFDLDAFKSMSVDTKGIKIVDGKTTILYQNFTSLDGQEREFGSEINPNTMIEPEDIPDSYLKSAKYILLATSLPESQLLMINALKQKTDAKIAVDTLKEYAFNPVAKQVFDLADIAFIDKEFTNLLGCSAPIKILKLGKTGSIYLDSKNKFEYHTPNIIENVTDKTGAGDVLAGTFLSVISQTNDPKLSLEIANIVATESIKEYGVEHLKNISLPSIKQGGPYGNNN